MSASEERADRGGGSGDGRGAGSQGSEAGSEAPFTQQVGRIVVGVIALLFLVFAFYNSQDVTVDWVFTTTETPLIIVLIGTFVLGALVGSVLLWRSQRGRSPTDTGEDR